MNDGNERANEISGIPRILGDEGKSKEVSRVFAAILRRGYDTRDESQGTVQDNWLDSLEYLAKEQGCWIENLSSLATTEIGRGHENIVFRSTDGNNVLKFNNLIYIYDKDSLIKFIDRLNSHNEFSLEAPYTILGFTKNPEGRAGLVMSQPYIKMAMEADTYTIENYLKRQGFRYEKLSVENKKGWTNGTFEFSDAVPRNVLMDIQGNLYFIDLQINNPQRLKQYLAQFKQFSEEQVVLIIKRRITDPAAKSFSPEQYQVLNGFVADKQTPAERKAVFDDLFKKATDSLQRYNMSWAKDVLEELDNLSKGITRSDTIGWHR